MSKINSRLLLSILLLYIIIWGLVFSFQGPIGYKITEESKQDLVSWYNGYNEEYFLNQLPAARVEWGETGNMGETFCTGDNCLIVISEKYHPSFREAQLTLFHEMCHIKLRNTLMFDVHGLKFQECMHTIADQGGFNDLW